MSSSALRAGFLSAAAATRLLFLTRFLSTERDACCCVLLFAHFLFNISSEAKSSLNLYIFIQQFFKKVYFLSLIIQGQQNNQAL